MITYKTIEDWFLRPERWEQESPCLNTENINKPPQGYPQEKAEWLRDLLTFQSLYPKEWEAIYSEYLERCKGNGITSQLEYYITDEGEIRKRDEQDVYLVIEFPDDTGTEELLKMGEAILEKSVWGFARYEEYCTMNEVDRTVFLNDEVKTEIASLCNMSVDRITIRCAPDLSCSQFEKKELFIDGLNSLFVVL